MKQTAVLMALVLALLTMTTSAQANHGKGPQGSEEQENEVRCGEGNLLSSEGQEYYAGENGVEWCNEGPTGLGRGRLIVSIEEGYVLLDNDGRNDSDDNEPYNLINYYRLDENGLRCGTENDTDGTQPEENGGPMDEDCLEETPSSE